MRKLKVISLIGAGLYSPEFAMNPQERKDPDYCFFNPVARFKKEPEKWQSSGKRKKPKIK